MAEGQPAHQSHSLLDRWRRLSARTKTAWKVGTTITVAGGALITAYNWLVPHLEITPGIVGSDIDAFQTEFVIKNASHFTIHNTLVRCDVYSGGRHYESQGNLIIGLNRPMMAQGIAELLPGQTATRNCGAGLTTVPFPATFDVSLTFEWPFYWWRTACPPFQFISIPGNDGHIHVQPDTN